MMPHSPSCSQLLCPVLVSVRYSTLSQTSPAALALFFHAAAAEIRATQDQSLLFQTGVLVMRQDAMKNGCFMEDGEVCGASTSSASSGASALFSGRRSCRAKTGRKMDVILRMAVEVAQGMAYLHARGIVHGDLTGANVLLQSSTVSLQSCPVCSSVLPSRLPAAAVCLLLWILLLLLAFKQGLLCS
jgi:hypothetical protein